MCPCSVFAIVHYNDHILNNNNYDDDDENTYINKMWDLKIYVTFYSSPFGPYDP